MLRPALPVLALAVILAACSSITPHVGTRGPAGPTLGPPDPTAGVAPDLPGEERTNARIRTACRTASRGDGWVATAYLHRMRGCPASPGDQGYTGAVLEYVGDRPPGAIAIVCADQRPPRGWSNDLAPTDFECPGARVGEGEPTAKTIRRRD